MGVIFQIALGGAFGAILRYFVGQAVMFPLGTLMVNVLGSFLMGLVFVLLADRVHGPFVMVGVLGGFTTFSAFSLDAFRLYEAGRVMAAGGYVAGSVIASILALVLGIAIARALT
ncbi:MAG: CrcB family protein [Pseudomonadota bacterium]